MPSEDEALEMSVEAFAADDFLVFKASRPLTLADAERIKVRIRETRPGGPYVLVDTSWSVENMSPAGRRARDAWIVEGGDGVPGEWDSLTPKERARWRLVARAVFDG
jgi:hypothetical protein